MKWEDGPTKYRPCLTVQEVKSLQRLTFYKNEEINVWLRGGNIVIRKSSFADAPIGFIAASNAGESSCDVRDSIFIGETDNLGQPFVYKNRGGIYRGKHWSEVPTHSFSRSIADSNPEDYISGIAFYQGPIYVDNCYFDRYSNWFWDDSFQSKWGYRPVRPGAAISFHRSAGYFSDVFSGVSNLKFGYCDDTEDHHYVISGNDTSPGWSDKDGSITASFRDYDGSLTGRQDSQVIRNRPFFTGPKCQSMPEWAMAACPYSYASMSIIGGDGVLSESLKRSWPTMMNRDDVPSDVIGLKGQTSNQWAIRTNMSYTIRFNDSLGDVPYSIRLKAFDLDRGEVIRLAICYPKDSTEFYITGVGPIINRANPAVLKDSVQEVDQDDSGRAYYWDKDDGLLYVKFIGQSDRQNPDERCPGGMCSIISIRRLDGGKGPALCEGVEVTPYTGQTEEPDAIGVKTCSGIDSPIGLGALTQNELETAPNSVDEQQCPTPFPVAARGSVEPRGCFQQYYRNMDMTDAYIKLYESMTLEACADHCYQRGFAYSANHNGYRCVCGNSFGRSKALPDGECRVSCKGNPSQTCGANGKFQIQTTGAALPTEPMPCGPGQRGVVFNGTTCLYLSMVEEDWPFARRRCLEMGGDLVKIDSQEKQDAINLYLIGLTYEVWAGLVGEDGQWKYLDGSPLSGFSNWFGDKTPTPTTSLYYLRLIPKYNGAWMTHRFYDNNMALCDLPLTTPPATMSCGLGGFGIKKGQTGPCFGLIHKALKLIDATYACHHMYGTVAKIGTEEDRILTESFLHEFGARVDYWVDSGVSQSKAYDYYGNERYVLKEWGSRTELGVVCRLDEVDNINHCPTGWSYFQGKCYLSRGDRVNTLQLVSAYCNSGRSQIVTIDNQEENDYVMDLVPGQHIWLGIQYKSIYDKFVWVDSNDRSFTNWFYSQPLNYLSRGLCAVLDPSSRKWRNKPCHTGNSYIVCEMPALN